MSSQKDNIEIDDTAWVHDSALLFGHISLGPESSVWPNVVMRSEMFQFSIGARTNLQDFVIIHVGAETPTLVGDDCSITHHATLHGCTIGDKCLIGINATIMDGATIGDNCIVAGHSIVTEGSEFPDNSIIAGSPAKLVKTRDSGAANAMNAAFYVQNAKNYAHGITASTKMICAPRDFCRKTDTKVESGWGGRIRTCACRYQKPVPYHLATPQLSAKIYKTGASVLPYLPLRCVNYANRFINQAAQIEFAVMLKYAGHHINMSAIVFQGGERRALRR